MEYNLETYELDILNKCNSKTSSAAILDKGSNSSRANCERGSDPSREE